MSCTLHFIAASQAFSCPSWLAQMRVMHLSFQQEEEGKQSCWCSPCPFMEGLLTDRFQWLLWGLVLSLSFSGFVSVTENMWMWSSKFRVFLPTLGCNSFKSTVKFS